MNLPTSPAPSGGLFLWNRANIERFGRLRPDPRQKQSLKKTPAIASQLKLRDRFAHSGRGLFHLASKVSDRVILPGIPRTASSKAFGLLLARAAQPALSTAHAVQSSQHQIPGDRLPLTDGATQQRSNHRPAVRLPQGPHYRPRPYVQQW
jgi:hypothetical protein